MEYVVSLHINLCYMCKPLDEYRLYLENLVENKSSETFSNGGKDYASILMSILLNHTKQSVCMFCEGFKPDLIEEHDYWESLERYLDDQNKKLHVIVNTNNYVNQRPLRRLFEAQKKRNNDGSIMVYLIDDEGREIIKQQFNGALNNFAVFDDDMYRLEYLPSEYKAFGSFNNTDYTKLLRNLFDRVLEKSQLINDVNA